MNTKRITLGAALTMVLANAAFAGNVKTDFDKSTNFAAYKTFMWIKEPKIADPLMRERVVRDINATLTATGLQPVAGEADLYIAAHIATKDERTLHSFYDGFEGGWRWSGGFGSASTTTTTYEIGTLVVDLFDGNTKETIWRGTSTRTVSGNPQKDTDNLSKALAKMFGNFPPPTQAKGGLMGWIFEFLVRGAVDWIGA